MVNLETSKLDNWIEVGRAFAKFSKCTRRKFAALYLYEGILLSVGYNGTVRDSWNCGEDVKCIKDRMNEPPLKYEWCPAVHAELNGILNASRNGISLLGSTLLLVPEGKTGHRPCVNCRRALIQAGIKEVVYIAEDGCIRWEETYLWVKEDAEWIRLNGRERSSTS